MIDVLAEASSDATSWPDVVIVIALIAAGCFALWLFLRD